jgi:hypothetical protein
MHSDSMEEVISTDLSDRHLLGNLGTDGKFSCVLARHGDRRDVTLVPGSFDARGRRAYGSVQR